MFSLKLKQCSTSLYITSSKSSLVLISYILSSIILLLSFSSSDADYISHDHQHNFTCVDWKRAPEAAVGNCTRYGQGQTGALRCYGGMNNLPAMTEKKVRKLEEIILCGWPEHVFNPLTDLQQFPKIRTLTIEYSGFTEIVDDFPEMFYLQSINISWTNLSHVSARTFKRVHPLKVVDLRWNQLVHLDGPLLLPRYFEKLYLAGNPWNCSRNFNWLLRPEKGNMVVDRDKLICTDRKYTEWHFLTVMSYEVLIKNECQTHADLQNCTCTMPHIIPKTYIPLYTVNCSGLQLERLPSYLPANTTVFYANDNLITDVTPLRNNEYYRNVVDVHLDNNLIESIDVLEGSYWIEHFRLLSLRGNRLQKFPVYAIDNALDENHNANRLQLSQNPWVCSCKFAMRFRELLSKHHAILRDAWNVTCTYKQGEETRSSTVLSILRQDICEPREETKIYPLDILNGVLASLIVFVLGKLAYDYYYYKNYGRVPWIVMRLP